MCYTAILDLLLLHNCNYSHFVLLPLLSVLPFSLCLSLKTSLRGIKARELIKKKKWLDAATQMPPDRPESLGHTSTTEQCGFSDMQWLWQFVLSYLELENLKYILVCWWSEEMEKKPHSSLFCEHCVCRNPIYKRGNSSSI